MSVDERNLRLEEFPSDPREDFAWQIVRAEPNKPVAFICLTPRPFGIRTHFYQGRTIPCVRYNCPACKNNMLSRYTGYLAALSAKVHRNVLVEYSAGAAGDLQKVLTVNNSLRGSNFILSRVGRKANGPLRFEYKGLFSGGLVLPPCPDVFSILCKVWRLDTETYVDVDSGTELKLSEHERVQAGIDGRNVQSAAECVAKALGDLPGQTRIEWPS
jgi:hypothetical protein